MTGAARRRRTRLLAIGVVLAVVLADQLTKVAVERSLALGQRVAVIEGYFDLTYVTNPGGVWSLGSDLSGGLRTAIFLALPLLITAFAVWYSLSLPPQARGRQAAIALVVGGAVGNLIDRLFRTPPEVVDFLLAHWRDERHWPAFNVADSAICVGVAVLLVASFREDDDEDESRAGRGDAAPAPPS